MAVFSKLIRTVAAYSTVLLTSKGLTLIASYLLAWTISDADFGLISLAQASFLTAMALLGINAQAAYVRHFYSHGFFPVFRALRSTYVVLTILSVAASTAVFIHFSGKGVQVWFSAVPIIGLIASWTVSAGAVYRCANSVAGYAVSEVGRPVVFFLAILAYVIFKFDADPFPYYITALCIATVSAFVLSSRGLFFGEKSKDADSLKTSSVLVYIFPLVLVQLTSLINNVGDRYFLAAYVSLNEIGLYGKAYLIGSTLGMLFDSLSILWAPYVMKHRKRYFADFHCMVVRSFVVASGLSLIFGAAALLSLYLSFPSERTQKLIVVSLTILAAYMARVGYQVCVPVLCAFDCTKGVAKISIGGAAVGIIVMMCTLSRIGVYGAAIATLISFAIIAIGSFILLHYYLRSRYWLTPKVAF